MAMKVRKQTKKYGTKTYKLDGVFDLKRHAEIAKRGHVNDGHNARIQKVSNGYAVWYHK